MKPKNTFLFASFWSIKAAPVTALFTAVLQKVVSEHPTWRTLRGMHSINRKRHRGLLLSAKNRKTGLQGLPDHQHGMTSWSEESQFYHDLKQSQKPGKNLVYEVWIHGSVLSVVASSGRQWVVYQYIECFLNTKWSFWNTMTFPHLPITTWASWRWKRACWDLGVLDHQGQEEGVHFPISLGLFALRLKGHPYGRRKRY